MNGNKGFTLAAMALGVLLGTTALSTAPAAAEEAAGFKGKSAGDFVVRVRGIWVSPDEDASTTIGGDVKVNNDVVPEVDFSYFITDNIALELIAATTRHKVKHTPTGIDLGKVSLLPPTLTLQYHFLSKSQLSPYVGAGLNYTFFYNEDAASGSPVTKVNYEDSLGYALQAGVDYAIDDHWLINVDVKKLFLNTDVKLNGGAIRADVDLDPWIVGAGIGYRF